MPPIAAPEKFLQKEYFLTNQQADFRRRILEHLKEPPKLIITDVEHLDEVRAVKPSESMLTSFAVLRGDFEEEAEVKD